MPIATASTADLVRKDLKTLSGAYVELKRLTYGQKLQRRAMTSSLRIEAGDKGKDFAGEMQMINEEATLFDFANCIVSHNLTKLINVGTSEEQEVAMDLKNKHDIRSLDPRVGEEIDTFISELNNFEDDEGE